MTKWIAKFDGKGYGTKLDLPDSAPNVGRCLIIVEPGRDTAMGYNPEDLKEGLRGHPGETFERITFVGQVAPRRARDQSDSLVYRYMKEDGAVEEMNYKPGESFNSVQTDGRGYWHLLRNTSDKPILLRVESGKPVKDKTGIKPDPQIAGAMQQESVEREAQRPVQDMGQSM